MERATHSLSFAAYAARLNTHRRAFCVNEDFFCERARVFFCAARRASSIIKSRFTMFVQIDAHDERALDTARGHIDASAR